MVLTTVQAGAAERLTSLEIRKVKLGGEMGRRMDITVENHLVKLNLEDDFLKPFGERNRSAGFIGLGMLIDAAVGLAAYTDDPKVIALKKRLVDETIKLQLPDGYLGMLQPEARMWNLWDVHEMAYIIQGLQRDYELFGEKRSLEAAKRVADYVVTRWAAAPDKILGGGRITTTMAATGVEPAMLKLHKVTGEARYLEHCVKYRKLAEWKAPIVLGRWGQVGGHAYAHCARTIAQLWLHDLKPDPALVKSSREVMDFLIHGDGMAVNGACGYRECWHDSQDGTSHLGETCATAYLLRLWDELMRREGRTLYGDLMERAILNALFAAQSPDGRRIRYYVPFEGTRKYFHRDSYCCPGNFRRILSELPQLVYYRSPDGFMVNLYTASTAELDLGEGLTLAVRQETDYPNSGRVVIHVAPSRPAELALSLRIPRWCPKAKLAVNGKPLAQNGAGGRLVTIDRPWKAGDRVELDMPMALRLLKGRKAQAGRVAVMRGPVVFCLNRTQHKELEQEDLREIVVLPSTLEGPFRDDTVRPDGLACRIRAWSPDQWYPHTEPKLTLTLSEFPDPQGEETYFKVANPLDARLADDELTGIDLDEAW